MWSVGMGRNLGGIIARPHQPVDDLVALVQPGHVLPIAGHSAPGRKRAIDRLLRLVRR